MFYLFGGDAEMTQPELYKNKGLLVWVEPPSQVNWGDNPKYTYVSTIDDYGQLVVCLVTLEKAGFTPPKSGRKRVKARLRLERE
jgi:hypothetical protein